jgi:hypothetical protein
MAYNVIGRGAASGSDQASDASAVLAVTTKTAPASAPSAPVIYDQTETSITITTVSGQEYSIDGGTTWQTGGVFSGLTTGSSYNIVTRVQETASAEPSAVSASLDMTLDVYYDDIDTENSGVDLYVNGERVRAGESRNSVEDGRTVTTVVVDGEKLQQRLGKRKAAR